LVISIQFQLRRDVIPDPLDEIALHLYGVEAFEVAMWDVLLGSNAAIPVYQRRKCEYCRRLDRLARDRLAEHLVRDRGLALPGPPSLAVAAAALAPLERASWTERMLVMQTIINEAIPIGRRFRTLYQRRDARLGAFFLAHRLALRDFAEAELAGETERSLDLILDLLGPAADGAAVAGV
jgi:hypothetical protein